MQDLTTFFRFSRDPIFPFLQIHFIFVIVRSNALRIPAITGGVVRNP
jgi:hypothetical protein